MQPDVRIHVERLVLRGLPRSAGADISRSLRAELQKLFGADGASRTGAGRLSVRRLDAGAVEAGPRGPADAGRAVARAVYRRAGP